MATPLQMLNQTNTDQILSAIEVARELRCSKAHIYNLILGKVEGVSALPIIRLGRRKVIRRSSFEMWKQANESAVPPTHSIVASNVLE